MLNIEIRILKTDDLNDFKNIRLSALKKAPKMFGSSYETEIIKPISFFEECLKCTTVFGVYHKTEIIGLATLFQEIALKLAHKSHLSSVFIEPDFQNKGIATQLINAVIEYSKLNSEQILLTVANDNLAAIRLYEKFGFQRYGLESKALKQNEEYIDEILMKCFLI